MLTHADFNEKKPSIGLSIFFYKLMVLFHKVIQIFILFNQDLIFRIKTFITAFKAAVLINNRVV